MSENTEVTEEHLNELRMVAFNSYDDFSKYSASMILKLYDRLTRAEKSTELAVKALELYSRPENWELPSFGRGHSAVVSDRGKVARDALEEIKRMGEGVKHIE